MEIDRRIDDFTAKLAAIKTKKDIENFCKLEAEYLRDKYALTTLKSHFSKYRKSIKTLSGKALKYSLPIMRLTREEKETEAINYADKISAYQENKLILDKKLIPTFLSKTEESLKINTFDSKMIGLALATGRRGYELVKKANFYRIEDIDKAIADATNLLPKTDQINSREDIENQIKSMGLSSSNCLIFWGQAKANEESKTIVKQPYAIPILADTDLVLEAFKWVRNTHPRYQQMSSQEIDSRIHSNLNKKVKYPQMLGMMLDPEHCKYKTLRKIYIAIAFLKFNRQKLGYEVFCSKRLGHGRLSKGTAQSYTYVQFV